MIMKNKTYDFLKYIQRIALPAVITFIVALGKIYDYDPMKIAGTLTAVDALMGALLQVSYNEYQKELEHDSRD